MNTQVLIIDGHTATVSSLSNGTSATPGEGPGARRGPRAEVIGCLRSAQHRFADLVCQHAALNNKGIILTYHELVRERQETKLGLSLKDRVVCSRYTEGE